MEIVLISDTKVTQSKRSSIQILNLMGEIGGFYEAIFMVIGFFASNLSAKMFRANVARSYYIKKMNWREKCQESTEKV